MTEPWTPQPGDVHLGGWNLAGLEPGVYLPIVFKLSGDQSKDLRDSAVAFCKAAGRCLNGLRVEPGVEILVVPGTTCAALSCELFLKYVVLRESGKHPFGHDLDALLKKCSADFQAALVARIPNVEQVLQRNRDHFSDARYHHEKEQFAYRHQELLQTAEALMAYVVERFPLQSTP